MVLGFSIGTLVGAGVNGTREELASLMKITRAGFRDKEQVIMLFLRMLSPVGLLYVTRKLELHFHQ